MKKSIVILFILLQLPSYAFSYDLVIPDTGQELCYNWDKIMCDVWHMEGFFQVCDSPAYCPGEGEDFYGQDATYISNPPDLTDNGDGTVTDNLTGLIWEQKTEVNETSTYSYTDALTYCKDLSLGGHDDWRMPTRQEYSTILNFSRVSPALDISYFPYYSSNDVYYWTSSQYHNDVSKIWIILISFGLIEGGDKIETLHKVQCVRGNALPASSFTDNSDGTVTDSVTGYIWEQKTDDGGSQDKDNLYTWNNALAYCESLLLGGYDDWRLPNPKELERIVKLDTSSPAIDTNYFPNTNNGLYWTGTSCSKCHYRKAFSIDFPDGKLYYGNKYRNDIYYENYVRCVRHPDPDNDGVLYPNDNCPYDPENDADNDSICGDADNCPLTANPGQEDVGEGDGAGDACDNCTAHPNGPNLGTCVKTQAGLNVSYRVGDPKDYVTCTSDWDCTASGGVACQNAQEDSDSDGCGDVCECYANFNYPADLKVNLQDLGILKGEYGRNDCSELDLCLSDGNKDGKVTLQDLGLLKNEYGRQDCTALP